MIHEAALGTHPLEACGVLLGTQRGSTVDVRRAIPVANTSPADQRRTRYAIDPRTLLRWEQIARSLDLSIVGFFHSHPDHPPTPSEMDAALAWPTYAYVIVSTISRADGPTIVDGMAAWTFDEKSSSFTELPIEIVIGEDEIEYYI